MPKVTVIIPVYNKMPYVMETIDSLRRQTLKDIEIIVVDNASTDDSPAYLEKCASDDNRIVLYTLQKNVGPAGAYKYGISKVKSKYFTIVDSDDFVDDDYLEILYNQAEKYNADITMCRNDIYYAENHIERQNYSGDDEVVIKGDKIRELLPQTIFYGQKDVPNSIFFPETGVVWIKLYRTDFVRHNNLQYNEDLWIFCDWEFNLRAFSKAEVFSFVNQIKYHYRQVETSVVHDRRFNPKKEGQLLKAVHMVCKDCDEINSGSNKYRLDKAKWDFVGTCVTAIYCHYIDNLGNSITVEELYNMFCRIQEDKYVSQYYKQISGRDIHGLREKISWYLCRYKLVRLINIKRKLGILLKGKQCIH